MSYYPFGAGTYYLGSSIGSTDTSILLSSFIEPVTGIPYTMTLINSTIVFATIGPKTSSSEFISFTGITQNANGTALLTGVTRGLAKKYPFTSNSIYQLPHSGQSTLIISDAPQVFEEFSSLGNDQTFIGLVTFTQSPIVPTPTTAFQAATKGYVDSVAIAGAPNASISTKGIVQEATTAQVNSGTATGSTGAILFASPADLAASIYGLQLPTSSQKAALAGTGTPSGGNKFVTADTNALNQLLSNLVTSVTGASDTNYPSEKAVYTYVNANPITSTNGITTKNLNDASGAQTIAHGLGRTPKLVRIHAIAGSGSNSITVISIGTYNGSTTANVTQNINQNGTTQPTVSSQSSTNMLVFNDQGSNTMIATITVDATNITLTWTKANSGVGLTAELMWEAI